MGALKVSHPLRFAGRGRVQVDSEDGTPFYVFDDPAGFTFTLPAGTYRMDGGSLIGKMERRKGHSIAQGVRSELPKRVRIIFAPNPHKACISLRDGVIIVDPSLRALPKFCLVFILFHEIGHYFYQDEERCDLFAAEEMHRRGFNASQIDQATTMTMGNHSRRSCNFETAQRLNKQ